MNPVTVKKRKKLRHARHKRESDRFVVVSALTKFIKDQKDMPSEFAEIVNKNYRELLY
jgi:hypothetical protein